MAEFCIEPDRFFGGVREAERADFKLKCNLLDRFCLERMRFEPYFPT